MARFSDRMVPEVVQVFWAAMARGDHRGPPFDPGPVVPPSGSRACGTRRHHRWRHAGSGSTCQSRPEHARCHRARGCVDPRCGSAQRDHVDPAPDRWPAPDLRTSRRLGCPGLARSCGSRWRCDQRLAAADEDPAVAPCLSPKPPQSSPPLHLEGGSTRSGVRLASVVRRLLRRSHMARSDVRGVRSRIGLCDGDVLAARCREGRAAVTMLVPEAEQD